MNMRFNKSTMAMAFRVSAIPILMNVVAACSPVNFSTVENKGPSVVENGTPTPTPTNPTCTIETVYRKTKIMFVVDASGSNSEGVYNIINNQNVYFPPSDPAPKVFRYGAINDFFSNYLHKTNFTWSFITFQGSSAQTYINGFTDQNGMRGAIDSFRGAGDGGQTPYAAGIAAATRAIQADPERNSSDQPNYFVIFLSDGFPTDYTDANGNFKTAQMQSDVAGLRAVASGRVSLSTIYYAAGNQTIPTAVNALKAMASAGGGQFASVNTANNQFKIDDVISKTEVCK